MYLGVETYISDNNHFSIQNLFDLQERNAFIP